jgi:hypothetical protein
MGTRADFYVGRGENAEWLGSIAWDGYSIAGYIKAAKTEDIYRKAVTQFLSEREDATLPKDGWPWPWEDSCTTDYAYAFDKDKTYTAIFGHKWFPSQEKEPEYDDNSGKECKFPNMKDRQKVALGKRSGVMIISG